MLRSARILFFILGIHSAAYVRGQVPTLKVNGSTSKEVILEKLDVDVQVAGAIATTTWTMTFRNNTQRMLEGELTFPLPEGITVSRYAIDINGKLREAVPVDKARGTTVLEAIENRRVDPGLLEKVDGNSFRTRIYPIRANSTRTVAIAYEEELRGGNKGSLAYRLPLGFKEAIPQLNINVKVLQSLQRPRFEAQGIGGDMQFDTWGHSWAASKSYTNYQSDKALAFQIPQEDDVPTVMMEQAGNHYYYLINTAPRRANRERQLPNSVTILWDVSLSSRFRNMAAEMELLDLYFRKLQHATVTVVQYSNKVQPARTFTVNDGNWDQIKTVLKSSIIDGGTQMGALDLRKLPGQELLLFSDGLSTYGKEEMIPSDRPVYCIASSLRSDFPTLRYYANATGGELLNLTANKPSELIKNLTQQPLRFLGIKRDKDLEETYPSVPTAANNGVVVTGISYNQRQEVILQYGYGNKVAMEQKVVLDAEKHSVTDGHLERIWAQKKIADLDLRYEANKAVIEQLGKRVGVITRNTSLIVLESLDDYLRYAIEPPAELRSKYDRAIKLRGEQQAAAVRNRLDAAEQSFNMLLEWWKVDYRPKRTEKKKEVVAYDEAVSNPRHMIIHEPTDNNTVNGAPEGREQRQSTVVHNAAPNVRPTTRSAEQIERLVTTSTADIVALGTAVHQAKQGGALSVGGGRTSGHLVIVDGVQYPTGTLNTTYQWDNDNNQSGYFNNNSVPARYGDSTGGIVSNNRSRREANSTVRMAAFRYDNGIINELKKVKAGDQYARYLEVRKDNLTVPTFYFHVAGYFIANGRKETGILVLSNLAELEMENYELYKMLGYRLRDVGEAEAAVSAFRKVVAWRPMDPQSYRDYGLALADAGYYQRALDTLYTALTINIDESLQAANTGIEETLVTEINDLIALHGNVLDTKNIPRSIVQANPVDIRVALNWNMKNTDIDLWVTDPNNEKCFYSHNSTSIGGRISRDFTQGFGPEQFMLRKAIPGKYKVEVNYYGDQQVKIAGPTTVMAEVYTAYGTPQQKREMMVLQMDSKAKEGVYIGTFEFRR